MKRLVWLAALIVLVMAGAGLAQEMMPDARVLPDVSLRLRAAPTTESEIVALLAPATPLTMLGVSYERDWLNVQTERGEIGWVFAEYVETLIDVAVAFPQGAGEVFLSTEVIAHIQALFAAGQARGNNANVFAKVGDSITVSTLTLHPIGEGLFQLGEYDYLQGVIDFYRAGTLESGKNSFNEHSLAAVVGWTSYRVLDPEESHPQACLPDEPPLLCEYRLLKPSVALIMFGTNDLSVLESRNYRANLHRIVELTEAEGIIPVLTTIPVRVDYEARTREFNTIISEVAREHAIPLLDYGGAMLPLGDAGYDLDMVHPSVPPRGYEGAADFRTGNLGYGYVVRNLTALQMLDAIWRVTAG